MTIPGLDRSNGTPPGDAAGPPRPDVTAPWHMVRRIDDLEAQVKALTERVATLEDAPALSKERDDLARKIVDFLRQYPGLKFTAPMVAQNLGEPIPSMHTRLRTLARQGLIATEETDGRRGRLFYLPAEIS